MAEVKKEKLSSLCNIIKGETGLAKAEPGPFPLVATGASRKSCSTYQFNTEAVCIPLVSSTGHGKKTLNYVHYQSGKFALGSILAAIIPKDTSKISAQYIHLYLSHFKDTVLVPLMKGAANVSLPIKGIEGVEIPVPSIEIQHKLISLINRTDNEHKALLDEAENQHSLLKQLRQTILQEAVKGKLTVGWRKEHPELISGENHASCLLEKIRAKKDRLIAEGKIKKEKFFTPISDEKNPFKLPEGWVWYRLGEIINVKSSKRIFAADYVKEGVPFYRSMEIGLLGANKEVLSPLYICSKKYQQIKEDFGVPKSGDILMACIGGSIGNTWVVDEREFYYKDGNLVQLDSVDEVSISFLLYYLKSPLFYRSALERVAGTSYDALTIIKINHSLFPLPPLSEQQTIVGRVDKLMAMIDELEKQVSERKEQAEMLMQSVLREAFVGA